MLTPKYAAMIACVLMLCGTYSLAQEETNNKTADTSQLTRSHLEFAYDDAEAGFNGVYLAGLYQFNNTIDLVGEASVLRGHAINHWHTLAGARMSLPLSITIPSILTARTGLFAAGFDGDSEFGILLGTRAHLLLTNKLSIESGVDLITAGENGLVWILGARFQFTDTLYFHTKYWKSDLDELTLGVGYRF